MIVLSRDALLRQEAGGRVGVGKVVVGVRVGELLAGAIVVEAIFARNGLGSLAISSVQTRDYLVVQALIMAAVFVARWDALGGNGGVVE